MSHSLNLTRIKDISFTMDMSLNLTECNRNMQKFFDISDIHNFNLGFVMDSLTAKEMKKFLEQYSDGGDATYFHAEVNARDSWIDCLFFVETFKGNYFKLNMIELEYAEDLIRELTEETAEFTAVLSSFDTYYFVHNVKKERIVLKNTSNLGELYEGKDTEFHDHFALTFGVNLKDEISHQTYLQLSGDIQDNLVPRSYKLLLNNGEYMYIRSLSLAGNNNISIYTITISNQNTVARTSYSERYDGLTGLYNKQAISELSVQKIDKLKSPCTLMVLDLDNFKDCNDNYGHVYGDKVLVNFASIIRESVRGYGYAGRIGGDEFLCVLDTTDEAEIRQIARNIRLGIQWSIPAINPDMVVTCSFGIARYFGNDAGYADIFSTADKCLYIAKNKGRNCYIIYRPELHDSVIVKDRVNSSYIQSGQQFIEDSYSEEEILNILYEKSENYRETVLKKTIEYLGISRVILYNEKNEVEFVFGQFEKDVRKDRLADEEYYKYFNSFNYFLMDNSNILDSLDKDKYELYLEDNIGSSLEFSYVENNKRLGLICYDVFKPAKTFNKGKLSFLLMISRAMLKK